MIYLFNEDGTFGNLPRHPFTQNQPEPLTFLNISVFNSPLCKVRLSYPSPEILPVIKSKI